MNTIVSDTIEIRVRYAEVDQMGALHHSRYWVYFEMGRTELLRKQGIRYADLEAKGVLFVVVRCSADYRSPARYDDVLELETTITRQKTCRIEHDYHLRHKETGVTIATAKTTLACIDSAGALAPIPESMQLQLDPESKP
ncbi:MAG: acyl-CoA thioesterase [Phycisphaerales bacterium]|jgi:acyl-CoA thioester hydrolase|nr:acyl-CoA thioesterase [Phycisphaerales bacterium]MBT7170622.1 acyl-CoA thioesterase [Phycisphaerales bacterium]